MKTILTYSVLGFTVFLTACDAQQEPIIADSATVTPVSSDFAFTEGPASDKAGNVYFTDQPNDRIMKWDAGSGEISVYMEPAGRANGLYFDRQGRLLACADEHFQLWRIGPDKKVTILVDDFNGHKLNGPNDLWVDPKGGIYFTDPYYQRPYWERKKPDITQQRVYYLSPDGTDLRIVADDLVQPNGIIGSPDGNTLYVADIGDKKTYKYSIDGEGNLTGRTLFAPMGSDGMTLDQRGDLYLTGQGVTVFNKDGEQITNIPIPQDWTANVTFGGADQKTLFITASHAVYTLQMNVSGTRW